MATVKVLDILDRASRIIQDTSNVRWTKAELLDYFNDAQREVVLHRPDAKTVNETFTCAASSKQTLPAAALRLIDVVRNVDGRVVTQVSRQVLDEQLPTWHNEPAAGATEVKHFVYDPRDPKTFYLYQKPQNTVQIEIVYSTAPTAVVSSTGDDNDLSDITSTVIGLDDVYSNPLLDYVLFRAYSKDTEYAGNMERAAMHLQNFANSLGVKMQIDAAITPAPAGADRNAGRS